MIAALREIDFCSLLLPANLPALEPTGPFSCSAGTGDIGDEIAAAAVVMYSNFRKDLSPPRNLGGAKAYIYDKNGHCEVYLPVSFKLIISFAVVGSENKDLCKKVYATATAAATTLATPEKVQAPPRWDACGALQESLNNRKDAYRPLSLDSCRAGDDSLVLGYGLFVENTTNPHEVIDGTEVEVHDDGDECHLRWGDGKPPTRWAQPRQVILVRVGQQTCDEARELARGVMPVVRSAPPTDVTPQRPILYGPDEPDMPK